MNRFVIKYIFPIICVGIIYSCASLQPYYKDSEGVASNLNSAHQLSVDIDYEIFFIGDIDAGQGKGNNKVVNMVTKELSPYLQNQAVVFLGNYMPSTGVPSEDDPSYQLLKEELGGWIDKIGETTKNLYFIPGNNEWNDGSDLSVSGIQASEDFLEEIVGDKNVMMPKRGCGEPVKIELSKELVLVLSDSQWLLQGDDNTQRKRSGCEIDNNIEYVTFLKDVLARNKRKNVVLASHHPILSNGNIGGNYPLKNHLLPFPVLGTVITGMKKIMGGPQKFGHPDYESYRAAMNTSLQNFEGVTMISGHDRNMQYHENNGNHYVTAGSGSEIDYARKADGSTFSYMSKGYTKIIHTKNAELWLEFIAIDDKEEEGKVVYRKLLYKKENNTPTDKLLDKQEQFKTVKTVASKAYAEHSLIGGKLYRDAWGQEIEVPVLYLDDTHGGLVPIQQGGGFQTRSLRLENEDGQQYVLRSINKDVEKVVPVGLRKSFVKSLVQDGIGAAHPYGALVIPVLAKAVGIYHANPQVVYVPHQKALGDYDADFAERLYLFEERPGGNTKLFDNYGHTKKTVNTPTVLEKIRKSHKHVVDQEWTLRSRLFDMWIGDWDRHDDQWRWARFKEKDRTIYRPIPRDRDQVFFKNDGIINYLSSRPYISPQLRKFEDKVDYLPGLVFNARYFDRSFLNQLNREDFINMASEIQLKMTDQVIEEAFKKWPKEIYDLNGDEIIEKLKIRRADLVKYAAEYYDHLSKEITITGTDAKDVFEIKAEENDILNISVYQVSKKGKKHLVFNKKIDGEETKELRLFGLKKSDEFYFSGTSKSTIKVRVIGGSGSDLVSSRASGIQPIVYDKPRGMSLEGNGVNSKIVDKKGVNKYDRKDWKLDRQISFPLVNFYTDEGVGLSYNYLWTKHGFRSDPYKSSHSLSASYFFKNSAVLASYKGLHPNAIGDWDFNIGIRGTGPTFTQYYYGLGNEYSRTDSSLTYHIVKGTKINIDPQFIKPLKYDQSISISPTYEFLNLKDREDTPRYIYNEGRVPSGAFNSAHFVGIKLGYDNKRIDNEAIPQRGYLFNIGAEYKVNTLDADISFLRLSTNFKTYIPFSQSNRVILAMNIGGAYNFGTYNFYHANYLATPLRLRGFKSNKFGGDGMVYHASDLRVNIAKGKGAFPFGLGVFGAFDYGRVWLKKALDGGGESAQTWHTSYGGGIYITPLDMIGLKFGYYVGKEDKQLSLGGSLSF